MNLGTMIYNNYKQALSIFSNVSVALSDGLRSLGVVVEELVAWEAEEVDFVKNLGREPEWDFHAVARRALAGASRSQVCIIILQYTNN